jgi:hypothetical protein
MGQEEIKCCNYDNNKYIIDEFENEETSRTPNSINYESNNLNDINNNSNFNYKIIYNRCKINKEKSIDNTNSYDSSLIILENDYDNIYLKKKIVKIQKIYKGYNYRKEFNSKIKYQLIKSQNDLYNELYEKYMKYNTKLAESLIEYKFDFESLKIITKKIKNKNQIKNINNITLKTKILINNKKNTISNIYSGEIDINNNRNGFGILLFSNGIKFEGQFENNSFNGIGRHINKKGDLFEGTFINGKLNGNGIQKSLNGTLYSGEFINGKKNGFGILKTEDYIYKGQFYDDLKNGKGKITFNKINDFYEGEFKNNLIEGFGIYNYENGDIYKGEFKNGKMNGKGLFIWKSGEEYYGNYVNGIKDGFGIYKYKNGKVYNGMFKNGKCNGYGKVSFGDSVYDTIFANGKLVQSNKVV